MDLGTGAVDHRRNDWVIITQDKRRIKEIKNAAEDIGIYDRNRLITVQTDSTENNNEFAIPVYSTAHDLLVYITDDHSNDQYNITAPPPFNNCQLTCTVSCNKSKVQHKTDTVTKMHSVIHDLAIGRGFNEIEIKELFMCLPNTWTQHGDMIILSKTMFDHFLWQRLVSPSGREVWRGLAGVLKCERIILQEKISNDGYRSPINQLVLGDDGWVTHADNGVHYVFDATRTMFSQGNITEKMRMADINCKDETVVDLFAGVGYFTLPILVHSGAKLAYACEWNPAAIEGLKRGLIENKVIEKCIILEGDNNQVAPGGVADRVVMGLIPSSEGSWETGCTCIRPDKGGWLHVHGNVTVDSKTKHNSKDEERPRRQDGGHSTATNGTITRDYYNLLDKASYDWACYVKTKISDIFDRLYARSDSVPFCSHGNVSRWTVSVGHIEHVKSYAPHVYHVVVDIECRPC